MTSIDSLFQLILYTLPPHRYNIKLNVTKCLWSEFETLVRGTAWHVGKVHGEMPAEAEVLYIVTALLTAVWNIFVSSYKGKGHPRTVHEGSER